MPNLPKEVIVVEGKSDTQRLQLIYGPSIKTIETNGSAIDERLKPHLKMAEEQFGLIVFTDPDYQGERIRRIIREWFPEAKHAYLTQQQAQAKQANVSLGIEHASPEAIKHALESIVTMVPAEEQTAFSQVELMQLGLVGTPKSRQRRLAVGAHFGFGPTNGRQLQRRLTEYGITYEQLKQFLQEEGDNG